MPLKLKDFAAGDQVRLTIGGPTMAVRKVSEGREIIVCQWFAGKKLEAGEFAPETLEKVNADTQKKTT